MYILIVLTCEPIQWPSNGFVHCEKSEFLYGSKCTVRCSEGYEMKPWPSSNPYQIMCNKSTDNVPTLDKAVSICQGIFEKMFYFIAYISFKLYMSMSSKLLLTKASKVKIKRYSGSYFYKRLMEMQLNNKIFFSMLDNG